MSTLKSLCWAKVSAEWKGCRYSQWEGDWNGMWKQKWKYKLSMIFGILLTLILLSVLDTEPAHKIHKTNPVPVGKLYSVGCPSMVIRREALTSATLLLLQKIPSHRSSAELFIWTTEICSNISTTIKSSIHPFFSFNKERQN